MCMWGLLGGFSGAGFWGCLKKSSRLRFCYAFQGGNATLRVFFQGADVTLQVFFQGGNAALRGFFRVEMLL